MSQNGQRIKTKSQSNCIKQMQIITLFLHNIIKMKNIESFSYSDNSE